MVAQPNTDPVHTTPVCQTSPTPANQVETPRNMIQVPPTSTKFTATPILDLCNSLSQAKDSSKCLGFLRDDTWDHFLHLINPRDELKRGDGFSSLERILSDSVLMGTKTK